MPHQCVRCGTIYDNTAKEILTGCSNCKSRFFFFVRQEKLDKLKEYEKNLTPKEKEEIIHDVEEIIGTRDEDMPVILDLESIDILKPGKYEIDLQHLFAKQPLIYRVEEGKYIVDLPTTFKLVKESELKSNKKEK